MQQGVNLTGMKIMPEAARGPANVKARVCGGVRERDPGNLSRNAVA